MLHDKSNLVLRRADYETPTLEGKDSKKTNLKKGGDEPGWSGGGAGYCYGGPGDDKDRRPKGMGRE